MKEITKLKNELSDCKDTIKHCKYYIEDDKNTICFNERYHDFLMKNFNIIVNSELYCNDNYQLIHRFVNLMYREQAENIHQNSYRKTDLKEKINELQEAEIRFKELTKQIEELEKGGK